MKHVKPRDITGIGPGLQPLDCNHFVTIVMAITCLALFCWAVPASVFVPLLVVFFPVTIAFMGGVPAICMAAPITLLGKIANKYKINSSNPNETVFWLKVRLCFLLPSLLRSAFVCCLRRSLPLRSSARSS